jgi:hypothetical protein
MGSLHQYLKTKNGSLETENSVLLPLCHTTAFANCEDIAKNGLVPTNCDVYKEDLLYFFYGKSRYLINRKKLDVLTPLERRPMAFLFRFDSVQIKRYLPFDSGGFPRYNLTSPRKEFEFEKSPSGEHISHIIDLIYYDHATYLEDRIYIGNLEKKADENNAVKDLKEFYIDRKMYENEVGKQSMAIEIQVDSKPASDPAIVLIPLAELSNESKFKQAVQAIKKMYKNITIVPYLKISDNSDLLIKLKKRERKKAVSRGVKSKETKEKFSEAHIDSIDCEGMLRRAVESNILKLCLK